MKDKFKNIISKDLELSEGVDLILKNEGMNFSQLDGLFESVEKEFEERINYQKTREAVIYNLYSYSNAAVVIALMVVFIILPILGYSAGESFENVGPYDLAMGFKIAP
jgi:hypothetical protein